MIISAGSAGRESTLSVFTADRSVASVAAFRAAVSTPAQVPVISGKLASSLAAGGWLESIWVGVVLTALLAALVAVLLRQLRRGHRVRVALPLGAVALLVTVLTVAAFANTYAGYLPDLRAVDRLVAGSPGGSPGGPALPVETVGSGATIPAGYVSVHDVGGPRGSDVPTAAVWVYTPPGYGLSGNTTRYPVVYLLHGYPGRSSDWFTAGGADTTVNMLIAAHDLPPVIVVAPDMNAGSLFRDTEGMNLPDGPQVETYLTGTIVHWVDTHLRTIAAPQDRVIGGMSAGGSVALDLGLRHEDVFGGVIAEEPFGDPGANTLPELHGSQLLYRSYSPEVYLPSMRFIRTIPVYLSAGAQANTAPARMLAGLLTARRQPVDLRIEPGMEHTWTEARLGLGYGLVWTAAELGWDPMHPAGITRGLTLVATEGRPDDARGRHRALSPRFRAVVEVPARAT